MKSRSMMRFVCIELSIYNMFVCVYVCAGVQVVRGGLALAGRLAYLRVWRVCGAAMN